ncbi:hypothetical protein CON41_02380 [Bacillus cereus]|nr:hypothetical protein CON41_02380 [Bacillus cereus]PFA67626.1 hypothetical protein CN403_22820 [Bacillus cereus]
MQLDSLSNIQLITKLIREQFNLPVGKPNLQELRLIVRELVEIPQDQRTASVWRSVVYKHLRYDMDVPLLEGLDMSDINLLQQQILMLLDDKGNRG